MGDAWDGDQHGLGEELYDHLPVSSQKTQLGAEAEVEVEAKAVEAVVVHEHFDGSLEQLQNKEQVASWGKLTLLVI
jgi:hypothetical protein